MHCARQRDLIRRDDGRPGDDQYVPAGLERGRQRWGELGRQAEIHYEESRMGTVQTGR